ncbi:LacI family DNA-binding transcriptional regulator [Streptomyces sp. Je 1-332]|uniref:LacI family DNA-binding transcriptional regulator n=1 Tax=Streptomyces sp. Je 1-332 TaxID=3231270 RepID=UPI003457F01A
MTDAARPTSADVARVAGVSRATVSRVVNGTAGKTVKVETRRRVLDAVRTLGYTPHAFASSLRAGRSQLVLMPLMRVPLGHAVDQLVEHLSRDLAERGLRLLIDAERSLPPAEAARAWAEYRPAAVIGGPATCPPEAVRILRGAGVDTILLLDNSRRRDVTVLGFHDGAVATVAAQYLVDAGHRRIACLVPDGPFAQLAGRRLARAQEVAAAVGATVEPVPCAFDLDSLRAVASDWRRSASDRRPTGVFAYNDDFALLLVQALQEAGFRVPGDIAVVGAGNHPLGAQLHPRLTTAHFDARKVSAAVGEGIAHLLADEALPRSTRRAMVPVLTRRDSA